MKMRFLAFFLALCLMFTMVPANVFAVTFDSQDGVGAGEVISTEVNEETTETPSEEPSEEPSEDPTEEPSEEPSEPSEPVVPGEGCTAYEDGMHVYEAVVTAPTCTEQGYTTYTCACGDTYVADYVDATGHNMVNGTCTECGFCELVAVAVTATNVEKTGKVQLNWKAVEGAAKYEVYRATAINGKYSRMYTTANTTYTNTKGETGVTYYYKVIALGENGEPVSLYSEIVSRTCTLPQPVVTVTNVEKTGKVKLTWETVEGAVSYKIYRSEAKNGTYKLMYTSTSNTYTNTNSVAGTTYYYKVMAVAEKPEANSAFSAVMRRTANCAKPTITGSADAKTGKPRINWEPVDGAVEYKVYRATSANGKYSLMYTSTSNTYQNTNAEVGKTYYYKIKAVGANADSASYYSNVVSVMAAASTYKYVYSSYTTTKAGSYERNTNLTLACKAINGTILAPGDTFSFNEIVGPRTTKKGYMAAPIVGGMGVGGGICQVSTTLFNVALYGNMKITQRRQHSVAVTYVPLGRDAMIYKTASDLKFVNDSPYYIKVVASSSNGVVKISLMTREPNVSPKSDVDLRVTYASGVYTLKRYYKGEVNYTCKSKY